MITCHYFFLLGRRGLRRSAFMLHCLRPQSLCCSYSAVLVSASFFLAFFIAIAMAAMMARMRMTNET